MASSPPFGLIIPSRPVLVEPQVISQTQYAFSFPSEPHFSHLVIFLLPGFVMPQGTLAGVYIQFARSSPNFTLLGAIGTEKQSAIFKVRDRPSAGQSTATHNALPPSGESVSVGISIEPAAALGAQLQQIRSPQGGSSASASQMSGMQSGGDITSTKRLAQRIIKNAFNFLSSFAGSAGPGGQEVVPLKSFQDWWSKFERRIENDPGFLEREEP